MKNNELLIAKCLSFVWAGSFGSFNHFVNLHLEQAVGLTGSQIGLVTFFGMLMAIILNPLWGYLADKTGQHILMLRVSFLLVAGVAALAARATAFGWAVLGVILFEALRAPTSPLLDFITTNYCENRNYSFGKVRVYGSAGFMLVSMIAGVLVGGFNVELFGILLFFEGVLSVSAVAFWITVLLVLCAGIFALFLPREHRQTQDSEPVPFARHHVRELVSNKQFQLILILTITSMITVDATTVFSNLHLVSVLGADENVISLVSFFMVMPEIIILPLGVPLIVKSGFKSWYLLSIGSMLMRLGIASFTTEPMIFAMSTTVNGMAVVMHALGTMAYIRRVVNPCIMGLAFTLLASSMALGRAVLSLIFGFIYENMSSFMVFRVGLVIVAVSFVIAWRSQELKIVGDKIVSSWQ